MKEKVILAYSGGLDTTALIPWLKETFDYEVICCCVNCGQGAELDGLDKRAAMSGASKLYIEDIVDECRIRTQISAGYFHGSSGYRQTFGGNCQKRRCYRDLPRCYR